MDARFLERGLEDRLNRLLGKQVLVTRGPLVVSQFTGLRPEVVFHVSKFEDFGGMTADGAIIARRKTPGSSSYQGYLEERPGRIIVQVTCLSGSYDIVQELLRRVLPSVLLALESLPSFSFGSLSRDKVSLRFDDFQACLASAEVNAENFGDHTFLRGTLTFHLTGFLHVKVTDKGGLGFAEKTKPGIPKVPRKVRSVRPARNPRPS